jgi:TRAP-type uncharacterized transport system fused permease subunit
MLVLVLPVFVYFRYVRQDPEVAHESLFGNLRRMVETHAEMTSFLTLLFATLGIMIGLFTVTGFINRMGSLLLDLGGSSVILLVLMSWIFGWLAGAGLPPTATYIIGAIVIAPPMQQVGISPWIAHSFVFLISIWGELSPPTSLTAAISARIADASFMRTMYEALKICAPITLMTFAIFTRPDMVVNPGWPQIVATLLVFIGTSGVAFAMFGRYVESLGPDMLSRVGLAALSFVVLFHPDDTWSMAAAVIVVLLTLFGVWCHNRIAAANPVMELQPSATPVLQR